MITIIQFINDSSLDCAMWLSLNIIEMRKEWKNCVIQLSLNITEMCEGGLLLRFVSRDQPCYMIESEYYWKCIEVYYWDF